MQNIIEMFTSVKTYILLGLLALVIGIVSGVVVAWQYQANKYEKQLLEISNKSKTELAKAQEDLIKNERKNQDEINNLNTQNAIVSKELAATQANLRKYHTVSGGLLIRPGSDSAGATASSSTPNSVASGKGNIELPAYFAEYVTNALAKADKCEADLNTAKDYAQLIEKFRKEHSKK